MEILIYVGLFYIVIWNKLTLKFFSIIKVFCSQPKYFFLLILVLGGIFAEGGIVHCEVLSSVHRIVAPTNSDHFCLFQNTIFELNSGVLVRIFGNQRVTKNANRVLIRIKILHHFFCLEIKAKKHEA